MALMPMQKSKSLPAKSAGKFSSASLSRTKPKTAPDRLDLCLPAAPLFSGVPRRYEHTRAVVMQDFTHSNIINIGSSIHETELMKKDVEREEAVQTAQRAVWREAEEVKQDVLARLRHQLAAEHEARVAKVEKAHTKKLREHGLAVEAALQKEMTSRVQQERDAAAVALKEVVERTEERCAREKAEAVAGVRREEVEKAEQHLRRQQSEHERKFSAAQTAAAENLTETLEVVRRKLESERKEEVEKTRADVKAKWAMEVEAIRIDHKAELEQYKMAVTAVEEELERLRDEISHKEEELALWEQRLEMKQEQYEVFVDNCGLFTKGQSSFVVQPIRPIDQ